MRGSIPGSSPGTRMTFKRGCGYNDPMLDLLQGIRVISFNHFLLGPMGIQALADLGADVIAVEATDGGWQRHWSSGDIWHDGQGMLHICSNRNKRSVALDLKMPKGKEIALKLIASADVVAENFRSGVMDKLGLGYDALRRHKPAYATRDGHMAISLSSLQALADPLGEPHSCSRCRGVVFPSPMKLPAHLVPRLMFSSCASWVSQVTRSWQWVPSRRAAFAC